VSLTKKPSCLFNGGLAFILVEGGRGEMKKLLVILYIIVMIFGALSIAEATVIDNLPRTGYMGGFGDSWVTYWGQSFLAEPGLAQSLTFELRYGSGDGDLNFRLLLTTVDGQWNGVDYSDVNPGIVLFESETLTLPLLLAKT